jgi:monovalent cation:H+ antiporter-2, CPA2 family
MHAEAFLFDMAMALGVGLAGGLIARALGFSSIIGYLVAGFVLGPFTPGYVAQADTIGVLAEVGVVFLMFGVGLHFDLAGLAMTRAVSLPGALVKMALVVALGLGAASLMGFSLLEGVVFGLAISVASTVVLVRTLQEEGLLETEAGRTAVGWVIVEDLATVVVLVVLPLLGAESVTLSAVLAPIGGALLFGALMLALGWRAIPSALAWVEREHPQELFVLAIVSTALGIASVAYMLGLSVALGAFVAGLVVGRSPVSQQAADGALPLRDAFGVLFFVSVGMLTDPGTVISTPGLMVLVIAIVTLGKVVFGGLVAWTLRTSVPTAVLLAVLLAQTGEFSFILARQAQGLGLLPAALYDAVLLSAVVSIAINPLLVRGGRALLRRLDASAVPGSVEPRAAMIESEGE